MWNLCQIAVSATLACVVQVCLPMCRMSVDSENIFLVLASVVLKDVYMEMIPQLLLVWMAFIRYRFDEPTVQKWISLKKKKKEKKFK